MDAVFFLSVAGATVFGIPALLFTWARWLNGKATAPRVVRRTVFVLIAIALLLWLPVFATVWSAFHTNIDIDDWHQQRILAEQHSRAIRFVPISFLVQLVAAIWLVVATTNYHWLARAPRVPSDPPYR